MSVPRSDRITRIALLLSLLLSFSLLLHATAAHAEDLDPPDPDDVRTQSKTYQYDGKYFSLRIGGGFLYDFANYAQDDDSAQLMDLQKAGGIRDLRGLFSGRLYWSWLTWTVGYMYDANGHSWRFRQTGLKFNIPQLNGYLFVGRTKEGISTNKFTVGYYGWTNERATINDAFLPILADGARWTATAFDNKMVYNIGAFADPLSDKESFNKNDWQVAARAVWLPLFQTPDDTEQPGTIAHQRVLHLALQARVAGANDDFLQYRSKPEAFLAQSQAIDTGKFEADLSLIGGAEAYYLDGPISLGMEYFVNQVISDVENNPFFHGGEVFAAFLFTGETHPYNYRGAFFDDVTPNKSFFAGGAGAWEAVLRLSYSDLDSESITGGRFMRVTPMMNWYISKSLRLEFAYGYGRLERDGIVGGTHFFQTRFQLSIE